MSRLPLKNRSYRLTIAEQLSRGQTHLVPLQVLPVYAFVSFSTCIPASLPAYLNPLYIPWYIVKNHIHAVCISQQLNRSVIIVRTPLFSTSQTTDSWSGIQRAKHVFELYGQYGLLYKYVSSLRHSQTQVMMGGCWWEACVLDSCAKRFTSPIAMHTQLDLNGTEAIEIFMQFCISCKHTSCWAKNHDW
jgi:hypothetical protein